MHTLANFLRNHSNDHCAGDGHVFKTSVKNSQHAGLPTLWRSFKCHPTGSAAEADDEGATLSDLESQSEIETGTRAAHDMTSNTESSTQPERVFGGKVQPGSAGWSYSAASNTHSRDTKRVWFAIIVAAWVGFVAGVMW